MIPITPKLILTGKETYDPEYSNVSNFGAMEAMKEFAIEVLKYNLKQYRTQMLQFNTGDSGKFKSFDEITLETIKELEK
jgi:thiamine pyrophosphokinase